MITIPRNKRTQENDLKQYKPLNNNNVNHERVNKMLYEEPEWYPNTNSKALDLWKTLRPLCLEEILEKSTNLENFTFDPENSELEYKRVEYMASYAIGFFKKNSNTRHGIVRSVTKAGQLQEGMY